MIVQAANRIAQVREYYFSIKLKEVAQLKAVGKPIINLGIGSPDFAPPKAVITALAQAAENPANHSYQSYTGLPALRKAIAQFYQKHFAVALDYKQEILPLMGSKEGIMHISMAFLNACDQVLIPDPGYLTYSSVAKLVGAEPIYYSLDESNDFLPNLKALEKRDLSRVKLMWLNYPNMPTGKQANKRVFKELISFAKKHKILLVNDNPYSFVLNNEPLSLLALPEAKDVALELNSLSKTFNMAGWRIGMVLGKQAYIKAILKVKSNMDSGMFYALQQGAVKALETDNKWFEQQNSNYAKRREIVWKLLDALDCSYDKNQVGLFVWAKLPKGQQSEAFCDNLLKNYDLFITPGFIFGTNGNDYIRVSLCATANELNEALKRITI